jgi:hypothetical protein
VEEGGGHNGRRVRSAESDTGKEAGWTTPVEAARELCNPEDGHAEGVGNPQSVDARRSGELGQAGRSALLSYRYSLPRWRFSSALIVFQSSLLSGRGGGGSRVDELRQHLPLHANTSSPSQAPFPFYNSGQSPAFPFSIHSPSTFQIPSLKYLFFF